MTADLGRGLRHAGQKFTLALMSRLTLQVGHLIFVSLSLLSLAIGVNPSGDLVRYVGVPVPWRIARNGEGASRLRKWASFPTRDAPREET
jgi:hypothetical protein